MSTNLPLLFGPTGPVPTPPATIRAALATATEAASPGATTTLPGSLVEDLLSTSTGAIIASDQARVDAVNNVSPYGANQYLLGQLGVQTGLPQGSPTNANALIVVSGNPGYVIPPGWTVADANGQYAVTDGGVIGTGGTSPPLFVVATNSNVFAIPPNTITTIVTSVPSPYALTVTNPTAGNPAQAAETVSAYRARLLLAQNAAISGAPAYTKTLLYAVPGVNPNLVAIRQVGSLWEIICGGGDPTAVAGAIYAGVSNVGYLTGSTINPTRNLYVALFDAPDSYSIVYVNPPAQTVTLAVLWNTILTNFYAGTQVNQAIIATAQSYLNSILVGAPINELVLSQLIAAAVAPVLAPANLTTLEFTWTVNGISASPAAGTAIIASDPESYFTAAPVAITSAQG